MIRKRPINLLLCLTILLTISNIDRASAQATVATDITITPNPPPITLLLDKTGNYTVKLSDIATVSGPNLIAGATTITPQTFGLSSIGNQSVTVTAYDHYNPLNASFAGPNGMAFDSQGNLYVVDEGTNEIRKIAPSGQVTTIAGNGIAAHLDGKGTAAEFNGAAAIAADNAGNLYVTEVTGNYIRKIDAAGNVTTLAGNGTNSGLDGTGAGASFDDPVGIACSRSGNLYICDAGNNKVRMMTPQGKVKTIAVAVPAEAHGTASFATSIVLDNSGNIFVLQANYIVKITAGGQVINFAGDPFASADIDGPGTAAKFRNPCSMTIDGSGNLFIVEQSQTIREISPNGLVTTLLTQNVNPLSYNNIACDPAGNLFFASGDQNTIRKKLVNGPVSLFAGDQIRASADNSLPYFTLNIPVVVKDPETGPSVSITTSKQVICEGEQAIFTATLIYLPINPTYQWEVNGTGVPNNNSPDYITSMLQNGDVVTCAVNSVVMPVATPLLSNAIKVTVNSSVIPVITVKQQTTDLCAGSAVTFEVSDTDAGTDPAYQWQVNNLNVGDDQPAYTGYLNNGDAVLCIVTSNAAACATPVSSIPVKAMVNALPAVSFSAASVTIDLGDKIILSPIVAGNIATYQWSPAIGLSNAGIASPVAFPSLTTKYNLLVTTTGGCQANGSFTINVVVPIIVPNTFTPNGDEINDLWEIKGLEYYAGCTVRVYNRYGALVYNSTGYHKPWDGTYNGQVLQSGTYYYIIDPKNNLKQLSGAVNIIK